MTKLYLFEPGKEGRSWAIGHMEIEGGRVAMSSVPVKRLAQWREALIAATAEIDQLSAMVPASTPKADAWVQPGGEG